jgi:hypothetical protein
VTCKEFLAIDHVIACDSNAAAEKNSDGQYPLVLALLSGREWSEGIQNLFEAARHVVAERDSKTGLYPFMLAATTCKKEAVNTTYMLLRAHPDVCIKDMAARQKEETRSKREAYIEKRLAALERERKALEAELSEIKNDNMSVTDGDSLPSSKRPRNE